MRPQTTVAIHGIPEPNSAIRRQPPRLQQQLLQPPYQVVALHVVVTTPTGAAQHLIIALPPHPNVILQILVGIIVYTKEVDIASVRGEIITAIVLINKHYVHQIVVADVPPQVVAQLQQPPPQQPPLQPFQMNVYLMLIVQARVLAQELKAMGVIMILFLKQTIVMQRNLDVHMMLLFAALPVVKTYGAGVVQLQ